MLNMGILRLVTEALRTGAPQDALRWVHWLVP